MTQAAIFRGKNDNSASGLKPPPSAALQYSGLFHFASQMSGCLALLCMRLTLRLWPLILDCCVLQMMHFWGSQDFLAVCLPLLSSWVSLLPLSVLCFPAWAG